MDEGKAINYQYWEYKGVITVDLTDIKKIIWEDCEEMYAKNEKIWVK